MNDFGKTSLFDKVIPKTTDYSADLKQCDDHKSYTIFTQGLFDVSGFTTDKYWEFYNFLMSDKDENGNTIKPVFKKLKRIECYLLKHPLFNFPILFYPLFQFVHHAQIGFKFIDEDDKVIRHATIQLQNSWYPSTSETVPFDLPLTCKRVDFTDKGDVSPDNEDIIVHLNDKTGIYFDLLEPLNYTDQAFIDMNKFTYFRGINLDFLKGTVNFNFFLESYKMWRAINTDSVIPDMNIPDVVKKLNTMSCHTAEGVKCGGGTGDGSLFVFNTFSPAFISANEGCIMNFADLSRVTEDESGSVQLSSKFLNFLQWTFSNLYCSKKPETYTSSFSKHYITLSTAGFNYNWALKAKYNAANTDSKNGTTPPPNMQPVGTADQINALFKNLRPTTSGKSGWLDKKGWKKDSDDSKDPDDPTCDTFDKLMDALSIGKSLVQAKVDPANFQASANADNAPFLCQGENYTCEIFSRYMVSGILNRDDIWTGADNPVKIDKHFDFSFNGTEEGDMTFSDNLFRSYSMYWPVAVFDDGYENGVSETEFNINEKFKDDKILYAKQAQLFKYLFKGQLIEAGKTSGNILMSAVSDFLSLPIFSTLIDYLGNAKVQKGYTTMTSVLTGLFYALFLYEFLGVEEVFVVGYPLRNYSKDNFQNTYVKNYVCEPYIYKFQIGKSSRAAIANNKCIEAYLKWIKNQKAPNPIFGKFDIDSDPAMKKLREDIKAAYEKIKQGIKGDPQNLTPEQIDESCKLVPSIGGLKDDCKILKEFSNYGRDGIDVMGGGKDVLSSLLTFIEQNPKKIPLFLAESLANFASDIGNKIFEILTMFMGRFTTICHQNYDLDPQIMMQTNLDKNKFYQFPDFNRPSAGESCSISCDIEKGVTDIINAPKIQTYKNDFTAKKFKAKYNIVDPYEQRPTDPNKGFYITLTICILIVIAVISFLIYKSMKK